MLEKRAFCWVLPGLIPFSAEAFTVEAQMEARGLYSCGCRCGGLYLGVVSIHV